MSSLGEILLFNPRAADSKPRIPNSILQVAASIEGQRPWTIVDGNREADPTGKLLALLATGRFGVFASTVMPGPQLAQALPITRALRRMFPRLKVIWGGYFPSSHPEVVVRSRLVDVVVRGPGDRAFPALLDALERETPLDEIPNLVFLRPGAGTGGVGGGAGDAHSSIVRTATDEIPEPDALPRLPYEKLDALYPMRGYLGRTYLGERTIAYHSSLGCPFACSFCAVVPLYNGRWRGASPERIHRDILFLKQTWGGDAIEFHDNNFFVSEKRVVAFADLIEREGMIWWGEGRIDTIDRYADASLAKMRDAGCRMIFFGAETGDDERLALMNKGGTQTGQQIRSFARRLGQFGIIPEYSFVLGTPAASPALAMAQIDADIAFIRSIKDVNPDVEIIIYVYSPVPTESSELMISAGRLGFRFPDNLDDWLAPRWKKFDAHKNPLTPWLTAEMVEKIQAFEVVLNGYYPTVSDIRLSPTRRRLLRGLASPRYRLGLHRFPIELRVLQHLWKYRQPETQGF